MPTQEKTESVAALRERLGTAKTAVLTEYRGLTVRQLADLRKQLKAAAAEYTIDELATLTRVPSRTIRFYQSKGALPGLISEALPPWNT